MRVFRSESEIRKNGSNANISQEKAIIQLETSHSLNSVRNTAKNVIQSTIGHGRLDYKIDVIQDKAKSYLPSDWQETHSQPVVSAPEI